MVEIYGAMGISTELVRYVLHEEIHTTQKWVLGMLTADQKRCV